MGASSSTRVRRASSDLTQGRRRPPLRSSSGTFLKTETAMLTPWHTAPNSPTSRRGSPRSVRSSFGKIPENDYIIVDANIEGGRHQRSGSRTLLGKLGRRKRASTLSSLGSNSTTEGMDSEIIMCGDVKQDRAGPTLAQHGGELEEVTLEIGLPVPQQSENGYHGDKNSDDVFLDVEVPGKNVATGDNCNGSTDAVLHNSQKEQHNGGMVEKAVQTEQVDIREQIDFRDRGGSIVQCDHCKRRCFCYRNDPYDSNSSTQSLRLSADEKNKRRRRRWSPLIKKRQLMLNQPASMSQSATNVCHYERPNPSLPMHPHPDSVHYPCESSVWMQPSSSSSPKRWHIKYRQNRRRRRTFSEDKVDEHESPTSSQCGNTNSDPSLCSQRSLCNIEDHRTSDKLRRAGLYNLCLQKTQSPLVKSSSCSPTVPLRRQTWSEKSRHSRPQYEGTKKSKGFLHMLRNLRSSCSETDISMEHRRSVDSEGYVDPFYITRNFSRLNLKRLSLSHPNLNCSVKGSTTPPSGIKEKVSAAVGRLERALTGKVYIGRTYSLESQQSTSTGWNSDIPGSPTDSDAVGYSYSKDMDAENGYMTFDPELNPPIGPRRVLSSSCSSVPSSPGFQDGPVACFDDVTTKTGCEGESIYESLDNYLPKRSARPLTSLPSSDCETPPEVPPRPALHRLRYRERMLRSKIPLPPIPIANSSGNFDNSAVLSDITSASSAGNLNSALHSLYKTTCRRNNFIFGHSSSCGTLPSFQMDSSEEDSVFERQVESTPVSQTHTENTTRNMGVFKAGKARSGNDGNGNHHENCNEEHGASSTISNGV